MTPRVLLTLDEPRMRPDGRMAGLQVRVHEMAAALARAGLDVTVATAHELVAPVAADCWITHPRMVAPLGPRVRARALVVDGFESPFGSFLAQAAALLPRIGDRAVRDYRAGTVAFLGALAAADRILCANESQRAAYLTVLAMLGRIGPRTPEPDCVLCVPSGTSPDPPPRPFDDRPHDPVLLWCGGCYPWFDVDTYLAALPAIVARLPRIRLRFAGIDGVAGAADELPLARRMREAVTATATLRARAEFLAWLPYARRGELYTAADVGVCTYGDHLETRFAMRTRVIDMIWGGLPLVVSAGDEMSRTVAAHGVGRIVPPGDPVALADAITALLGDPAARRAATARARALATGELAWDRQVAPLVAYAHEVAAAPTRPPPDVPAHEAIVHLNAGRARRIADELRRLAGRAQNAWRLARRAGVGPVVARVRA